MARKKFSTIVLASSVLIPILLAGCQVETDQEGQVQLLGCARLGGVEERLEFDESEEFGGTEADRQIRFNQDRLQNSRLVEFEFIAGPYRQAAPPRLKVGGDGALLEHLDDGRKIVDAHIELQSTNGVSSETVNPSLRVSFHKVFEPGVYQLRLCLQDVDGLRRIHGDSEVMHANFTVGI